MFVKAAEILQKSKSTIAFTGAGISVESGLPPFRGDQGIWGRYDPQLLEIRYFLSHQQESWQFIRDIFYKVLESTVPNVAHRSLAALERHNLLQAVITQNIDYLHQDAGSRNVLDFHGTARYLVCLDCCHRPDIHGVSLTEMPPPCPNCQGVLKPDFTFFGEAIPEPACSQSFQQAERAEVVIVIGTTGEVMPAAMIPMVAKEHGATIIEVNVAPSRFTHQITDIFLQGPATKVMSGLLQELKISA